MAPRHREAVVIAAMGADGPWLEGRAIMRGFTLVWPTWAVAKMLPDELSLGAQSLTPEGTHPVVMFFNDIRGAEMNFPPLLPSLTYREQIVGVPYTFASCGRCDRGHGPMFYMPHMAVDNATVIAGAVSLWGFDKRLAEFVVGPRSYDVFHSGGERVLGCDFDPEGALGAVSDQPHFATLRGALDQPLVSRFPLARGHCFAASEFERFYRDAAIRPIRAEMRVEPGYAPDFMPGRYPLEGRFRGIDESPLGGFELHTRWRLGTPFPVQNIR